MGFEMVDADRYTDTGGILSHPSVDSGVGEPVHYGFTFSTSSSSTKLLGNTGTEVGASCGSDSNIYDLPTEKRSRCNGYVKIQTVNWSFCLISFIVILLTSVCVGYVTYKVFDLQSKYDSLQKSLDEVKKDQDVLQKEPKICLPCHELSQGPFVEDNLGLDNLNRKEEAGRSICCAKTIVQTSILLNLFAKRKQLEKCAKELLADSRNNGPCNQTFSSGTTPSRQNSGTVSAHLLVGVQHYTADNGFDPRAGHPIRNWLHDRPGTHLKGVEILHDKLFVPETGLYFVYSQASFLVYYKPNDDPMDNGGHSLFHSVIRYNVIYPLGNEELLRSGFTQCWDKQKDYGRYTNYVGASLFLNKGDQMYVNVSRIQVLSSEATLTYFGYVTYKVFDLQSKCDSLQNSLDEVKKDQEVLQKEPKICLPCHELSQGPFVEDNLGLDNLNRKEEAGRSICCAKTIVQTSILLNLFAKRKQLEKCAKELLADSRNNGPCNQTFSSGTTPSRQNSGTVSAHLLVGVQHYTADNGFDPRAGHPIRNWLHDRPGTHLKGVEILHDKLFVPETGLYFVYSQASFLVYYKPNDDPMDNGGHSLFHSVIRYNVIYPLGNEELLRSGFTQCWDKQKEYGRYTNYVGASLFLNKGDQMYVNVSRIQVLSSEATLTYFGMFRLR